MNLNSPYFAALVICALIVFSLSRSRLSKQVVLTLANAVFLLSFFKNPRQFVPFFIFLAVCYLGLRLAQRFRRRAVLALAATAAVAIFACLKGYLPLPPAVFGAGTFVTVGLSYILFRTLHLMIDASEGAIQEPINAAVFFRYACFFLSFTAGPIQRFEDYKSQEDDLGALSDQEKYESLSRIVNGYLKTLVVAEAFLYAHGRFRSAVLAAPDQALLCSYLMASACYTLYMYFNFSGYMDVVIGLGRWFGFRLPENFARPFESANFLDFWSRWHITLSDWFRFYVFNMIVKALSYRFTNPRTVPYIGVFAFFVTFAIMGLWHGSAASVAFGLLLGTGASVNKLYQVAMRKRLGKKGYARLCESTVYRRLCTGLALSYVSVSLTTFWLDYPAARQLFASAALLTAPGVQYAFDGLLLMAVAVALLLGLVHAAQSLLATVDARFAGFAASCCMRSAFLAVRTFVVIVAFMAAEKTPEFVYMFF